MCQAVFVKLYVVIKGVDSVTAFFITYYESVFYSMYHIVEYMWWCSTNYIFLSTARDRNHKELSHVNVRAKELLIYFY
jgi:hypothetical protein